MIKKQKLIQWKRRMKVINKIEEKMRKLNDAFIKTTDCIKKLQIKLLND